MSGLFNLCADCCLGTVISFFEQADQSGITPTITQMGAPSGFGDLLGSEPSFSVSGGFTTSGPPTWTWSFPGLISAVFTSATSLAPGSYVNNPLDASIPNFQTGALLDPSCTIDFYIGGVLFLSWAYATGFTSGATGVVVTGNSNSFQSQWSAFVTVDTVALLGGASAFGFVIAIGGWGQYDNPSLEGEATVECYLELPP